MRPQFAMKLRAPQTVRAFVRTDRERVEMSPAAADALAYMRERGMRLTAETCALLQAEGHANPAQVLLERFAPFGLTAITRVELLRLLARACAPTSPAGMSFAPRPEFGTGDGSCAIPHPMQTMARAAGQASAAASAEASLGMFLAGAAVGAGIVLVARALRPKKKNKRRSSRR